MRHSQTRGDWSMHLCDAPVQDRNEERMTGDNLDRDSSNLQLHQEAQTSSHFLLCCMFVSVSRGGEFEESPRGNKASDVRI